RAERNEANSEFLQQRKDLVLWLPPPEGVLALEGRDWLNGMGAADRLSTRLRHAEMLYLALCNEIFHGPGDVFHRHVRVNTVLIEQIDDVGPEALQSRVCHFANTFRPAVQSVRRNPVFETELGRDDNFLAEGLQCLADHLFVQKWAIGFRGVKKCHAVVERRPDQRDRRLPLRCGAITEA